METGHSTPDSLTLKRTGEDALGKPRFYCDFPGLSRSTQPVPKTEMVHRPQQRKMDPKVARQGHH